jgi:hypothetical protein
MRLKTEIWIQALIRRAETSGAMAMVVSRGDRDAGGTLIRINRLAGCSSLLSPVTALEGGRVWRVIAGPKTADLEIEALIAKECKRDPDLWVVEIEDRQGRHFIEETVEGIW